MQSSFCRSHLQIPKAGRLARSSPGMRGTGLMIAPAGTCPSFANRSFRGRGPDSNLEGPRSSSLPILG